MASTRVGALVYNVVANTAKFVDDMKKVDKTLTKTEKGAKKSTQGFAGLDKQLKRLGGAAAGLFAVERIFTGIFEQFGEVDKVTKTSEKLGIATDNLIALRLAGEQLAGVTDNTVDMALQRMTRRISEAAIGTGEAQGALAELGVDVQRLNALDPGEAFAEIADAMSRVDNEADRLRLAFKLFDSEGAALVNVLNAGGSALDEFREKARRAGITFSDEMAKDIADANDAMSDFNKQLDGLKREVALLAAGPTADTVGGIAGALQTQREIISPRTSGEDRVESMGNAIDAATAGATSAQTQQIDLALDMAKAMERTRREMKEQEKTLLSMEEVYERLGGTAENAFDTLGIREAIREFEKLNETMIGATPSEMESAKRGVVDEIESRMKKAEEAQRDSMHRQVMALGVFDDDFDKAHKDREAKRLETIKEGVEASVNLTKMEIEQRQAELDKLEEQQERARSVRFQSAGVSGPTGTGSRGEYQLIRQAQQRRLEAQERKRIAQQASGQRERLIREIAGLRGDLVQQEQAAANFEGV